ncbi:hypothetical protein SPRG_06809 [Saprolegnia parasitica CBS 223.65]|uniref:Uncharacterized protein n=1 Tax=Saprolegnia parasitica (strain CBS 223.65) TaxID=695850 RepID=A0A067CLV6_SAPPC|nr:hypothetical protein SPRG_06809 [Saprolegnia parasitica CBS 223.65]KDO27541.1 hypothetical protein SPRG_06809 [Saprolegnia parasitica CBS 223.65]|eukprot:XP_012201667.1 hypothetical protein SPRG_06809 [Saprolegnia parasitica CBS 223.65]
MLYSEGLLRACERTRRHPLTRGVGDGDALATGRVASDGWDAVHDSHVTLLRAATSTWRETTARADRTSNAVRGVAKDRNVDARRCRWLRRRC